MTTAEEPVLDHVVFATRSRAEADRALADEGLASVEGRVIPGMGLTNRFVPLGSTMLELHYPNGEQVTVGGPPYAEIEREVLARHPDAALVPVVWLVRFDDPARLREVSARDGCPVLDVPPSGDVPGYLLGGFGSPHETPWLPPLIHWLQPPAERLAARPASHRREPSGELTLEVSGPAQDIADWCGGHPGGVHAVDGKAGPLRATVGFTDGGTATFGV